jgi:DNA-binding NtrC family response regulator
MRVPARRLHRAVARPLGRGEPGPRFCANGGLVGRLGIGVTMRILIVDDEPTIRRTLRIALEAMGHEVAEAASGEQALEQAELTTCDVALVDLRLGGESGLDLLEKLREGWPPLAIVVITAHPSIATAVEAMRRGAFDYLPKPFSPAEVKVVLERVAQSLAELPERIVQTQASDGGPIEVGHRVSLERVEIEHIRRVLNQCTSLEEAAQVLGIDPSTLYRKRKRLGL